MTQKLVINSGFTAVNRHTHLAHDANNYQSSPHPLFLFIKLKAFCLSEAFLNSAAHLTFASI
jgi:hypothetical protein